MGTTSSERIIEGVAVNDVGSWDAELPPIVMVHGGCHGAWCWATMQDWYAARGWRTVALDWFAHGRSGELAQEAWLARDIIAVREEVGLVCAALADETGRQPVVMGHSMGGLATLAHVALGDQLPTAAVLLAPVVPAGYAEAPVDVPVSADELWGPPPPELARQLFYGGATDADAERFHGMLQPESPAAVWQATRWTAELPTSRLRELPVLAFGAERDLLVPPDAVRRLAEGIGAEYVHLPGTGHGLTLDPVAGEVCRRAEEWLRRQVG